MKKAFMFLLAMGLFGDATAVVQNQNFIVNGRFVDNDCQQNSCIFNTPDKVRGWIPEPQIEIGYGYIYNGNLGNKLVLDLAANSNGCVTQKVKNMQPGVYTLTYEYAARWDTNYEDSQFTVDFNKNILKKTIPANYNVNYDSVDIEFKQSEGDIRFCSVEGKNDANGALIASVILTKKSNSSVVSEQKIQQSNQPQNGNLPKIIMDSHSGKCLQKKYNLEAGTLMITFDYGVNSKTNVKDSAVFVVFDGKPIQKILPSSHGQNIRLKGQIVKGTHTLGFCSTGHPNEAAHQISISNINLYQQKK